MKEKVILDLDFNQGAIWISDQETGEPITGIEIIDYNKDIASINKKISDLYSSYYRFDSEDSNCSFDKNKFFRDKELLLKMVDELKQLLENINDGSFEIEDRITKLYD